MKPEKPKNQPTNHSQHNYDFSKLCNAHAPLTEYVFKNKYQTETVDFSNPKAVKALNTAILFANYKITFWDFPKENLCPPIPGRLAYIHQLAKLLKSSSISENATLLDIGTGAGCIYPILGNAEYGWQFVGTDIDKKSLKNARQIIDKNNLSKSIRLRCQPEKSQVLKGIIFPADTFAATLCNPPFYSSKEEAFAATKRKLKGLGKNTAFVRNFSGTHHELWYKGGEIAFIANYARESVLFQKQCNWFTALVSKKENIRPLKVLLKKLKATTVKTIAMQRGNKNTRILAWTFLPEPAIKY